MNLRSWFAVTMASLLMVGGLLALDGALSLFSLPSNAAVFLGVIAVAFIALIEAYGFLFVKRILKRKED